MATTAADLPLPPTLATKRALREPGTAGADAAGSPQPELATPSRRQVVGVTGHQDPVPEGVRTDLPTAPPEVPSAAGVYPAIGLDAADPLPGYPPLPEIQPRTHPPSDQPGPGRSPAKVPGRYAGDARPLPWEREDWLEDAADPGAGMMPTPRGVEAERAVPRDQQLKVAPSAFRDPFVTWDPLADAAAALGDGLAALLDAPGKWVLQTIIVSKEVAKTVRAARKLAARYGNGSVPVDETETSFRFRQVEPSRIQKTSFRTFRMAPGVSVVRGRLRR